MLDSPEVCEVWSELGKTCATKQGKMLRVHGEVVWMWQNANIGVPWLWGVYACSLHYVFKFFTGLNFFSM